MGSPSLTGKKHAGALLALLVLVAAYIRVDGASVWHVSPDDINHIEMAQGGTAGEVVRFSLFETHPPLGNLIRHVWMLASQAPWFLRSLSLLFGLALIPLYDRIGARLGGPWAGLCCAALAAFSHGVILQSYVVRNYTIFLFFLSWAFYAYLLWREKHTGVLLGLYGMLGCLATLTHFSGMFGIFCIASLEAVLLLRARNIPALAAWLAVNLLIAAIALAVMWQWLPLLALTRLQIHRLTGNPRDWLYPVLVMDYLFAYRANAVYCFTLFTLVLYAICVSALRIPGARIASALAVLALATGSALVISGTYQAGMTRTSLWLFPFIAPPVGCALSLVCARAASVLPQTAVAGLLLLLGCDSYSPAARFRDGNEYMITESEWAEYVRYLSALDATHLIVASRSDAFLIAYPGAQNLYDFYDVPQVDEQSALPHSALLPYHRAQLLFKPYYFNYSEKDLVAIVKEAEHRGQLRGIDTLVFTGTLWSSNATLNLILCPALEKTVTFFPPLPAGHTPTEEEIAQAHAFVLEVPKDAFLSGLVAPGGRARECLKGPPA
jgi:hypothetical protein